MREVSSNFLAPSQTILFRKKIIGINQWTGKKDSQIIIREAYERVKVFLLPVGEILAFNLVEDTLHIVIQFHPESIIQNLPRYRRDMAYVLTVERMEDYLNGSLPPLAESEIKTCKHQAACKTIRKKLANFLQSFTIRINKMRRRNDRLSARKTLMVNLETEEEIRNTITELQVLGSLMGEKTPPEKSESGIMNRQAPFRQETISYRKIFTLFGGTFIGLEIAVRQIWDKIKTRGEQNSPFWHLRTGRYLID